MSVERSVHLMGTIIKLRLEGPSSLAAPAADQAIKSLRRYEQVLSANDDHSILMRLNHQAGIRSIHVPPELFNLIQLGKKYSLYPGSYLNIAIGPLVKLWHIGFKDAHVPDEGQINAAFKLTDPQQIILDEDHHSVYLQQKGMEIDLGALAKGYSADLIADQLRAQGITSGIINLGGNVVVMGRSPAHSDGYWRVGLQDPQQSLGHYIRILKMQDQSIVTSGIYERNLKADGHFYHHIFDPQTGYPVNTDLVSLSILSPRSVDGEIWTSALFGQDWPTIQQTVAGLPDIHVIAIDRHDQLKSC